MQPVGTSLVYCLIVHLKRFTDVTAHTEVMTTLAELRLPKLANVTLCFKMAAPPDAAVANDLHNTARFTRILLEHHPGVMVKFQIDIINREQDGAGVAWLNGLRGHIEDLDKTLTELLVSGQMKDLDIEATGIGLREKEVISRIFRSSSQHPRCRINVLQNAARG